MAREAGNTGITIDSDGTYALTAAISGSTPGSFAVEINGTPAAGGTLMSAGNTSMGSVVFNASAGDTVTVVNVGTDEVTLPSNANGAPNASVYLQKLS